jgi:serine/threonine protein kinase
MFGFRGSGAKLCSERPGETLRGAADLTEKSPYKFERDYTLEQKLRSGSYGVVHTTRHKKTGEEYAVKVIDRKKLKEKDDKATFGEIAIMKDLTEVDHIVRLIDVYIVPEFFYIVQVYAQGGDVFDRLAKRVSYTEKDGRDLSVMLLSTMKQLHERRVCHRDLKPENLLLQGTDDDCNILLADFGFAKYVPEDGLKTRCGTPAFVAPEIIVGARYSTQADNWSVGCLIYMLLGGYPPFQDETHRGLFRKVRAADFTFHDKYWSNVSLSAKQLITNLLTVDPEDRFDASEALGSSWLKIQPERLSTRDLSGSISEFQSFNARRTLKSAINTVVWSVGHAFQVDKINDLLQETDKDDEDETLGVGALALGGVPHKLNMSLKKKKRCDEVYEIGDKIHSGSMAVVKVCRHRENNKKYAVKIIKRSSKTDEAVLQEVAIMNQMHHPNLVSVVDFFEEDDFHYMIMELMEGGDVFDRIIGLQSYTEKDARDLAKILLEAVYYMHKNGIAHRDVSC